MSCLRTVNPQSHSSCPHSPFQGLSFLPAQLRMRISRPVLFCLKYWNPILGLPRECHAKFWSSFSSLLSFTLCFQILECSVCPNSHLSLLSLVRLRTLCGTLSPALWSGKILQEEIQGGSWAHPVKPRFCSACYPMSENNSCMCFVQFSGCLQQKGWPSDSIMTRIRNLFFYDIFG